MTSDDLEKPFIVENLKQYHYCPRIVFFDKCMPGVRPQTIHMVVGREDHEAARRNAQRRSFVPMGLANGQRAFDVDLIDPTINLRGRLDEIITTEAGEMIPVEYKATRQVSNNHHRQVAAYAVLIERVFQVHVTRGFVYLIPLRKVRPVNIQPEDKQQVLASLEAMANMVHHEIIPPPTEVRARCVNCEFRRFCNDV